MTVKINSRIIKKTQAGDLPPLIMLHGWNRTLQDLLPLGELLSPYMEIHLLDLPGFGESSLPDGDWDTSQYAGQVLEYLKGRSIERFSLLGHSFGGRISIRISSAHPEKVDSLILIGSHGLTRKRSLYGNVRVKSISLLGKTVKKLDRLFNLTLFKDKFAPRFGSPDYRNAGPLRGTLVKTVNEDQAENAKKIKARTLLLWGSEDNEAPVTMAQEFNSLIKDSHLIVLPGKDHSPFHGAGAHLCAHHIISFLKPEQ